MSRSRRKKPFIATTTCKSEKDDKRVARRRLRLKIKACDPDKVIPHKKEVSDVWLFGKDGKHYSSDPRTRRK